jgi:hypothetical protein
MFCVADVYHSCSMQHKTIIFVAGSKPFMTASQKLLILVYKIVCFTACLVVLVAYFGNGIVKLFNALFIGYTESPLKVSGHVFSDVEFIEGYIPGLVDTMYNKPLLACSLKSLDTNHIHWEGNWKAYNLNSEQDFPIAMSEVERDTFFGSVAWYPPDDGDPALTYGQYMERHFPNLVKFLERDGPDEGEDAAESADETNASKHQGRDPCPTNKLTTRPVNEATSHQCLFPR